MASRIIVVSLHPQTHTERRANNCCEIKSLVQLEVRLKRDERTRGNHWRKKAICKCSRWVCSLHTSHSNSFPVYLSCQISSSFLLNHFSPNSLSAQKRSGWPNQMHWKKMQNYADYNPRLPNPFESSVHACLLTRLAFPEQNISAKVWPVARWMFIQWFECTNV